MRPTREKEKRTVYLGKRPARVGPPSASERGRPDGRTTRRTAAAPETATPPRSPRGKKDGSAALARSRAAPTAFPSGAEVWNHSERWR